MLEAVKAWVRRTEFESGAVWERVLALPLSLLVTHGSDSALRGAGVAGPLSATRVVICTSSLPSLRPL